MLPHSDEVMKRAGVEYVGAHDALADARMVISAVRKSPYFILQKALALLSEAASDNFDRSKLADLYGQIPAYLKERK
jgi:hypothetical protein